MYCDLHDTEIPSFLLRNVNIFCNNGGFTAMMSCFEISALPVSTAHAITATISNLKLLLNYRSVVQLFVPLRIKVLQYMCKLSDQDLRSPATKSMADFMWAAIKDPLDTQVTFDTDGLALAFKYFTSTTLTMRLAGSFSKRLFSSKYTNFLFFHLIRYEPDKCPHKSLQRHLHLGNGGRGGDRWPEIGRLADRIPNHCPSLWAQSACGGHQAIAYRAQLPGRRESDHRGSHQSDLVGCPSEALLEAHLRYSAVASEEFIAGTCASLVYAAVQTGSQRAHRTGGHLEETPQILLIIFNYFFFFYRAFT